MQGLALSRQYYQEVIAPLLLQEYGEYVPRIAAGLVGEGSECYGYDDDISQDHEWGATVCLWLTRGDYEQIALGLRQRLQQLPDTYQGYPVYWVQGRNGVLDMHSFYQKFLSVGTTPQTVGQWRAIPEHHLSIVTNGEVFADPLGEFTALRNSLIGGYPEDMRRKKLAARCMTIGQAGQYNFPRCLARNDKVAAHLAEAEAVRGIISVVYLLNHRYTPYYKWMHYGLQDLPVLGRQVYELLKAMSSFPVMVNEEDYYMQKINIINQLCGLLIEEFQRQGLSNSQELFLVEHGYQIHAGIVHEGLRNTNPWIE